MEIEVSSSIGCVETGFCFICLSDEPPPIQSGCACRGDAGLAHVECRVKAASHRYSSEFIRCQTCGQRFTCTMLHGMANMRWEMSEHLPKESEERLSALHTLTDSLMGQGKYADAEYLLREVLGIKHRLLGPEHKHVLTTVGNLAASLQYQKKWAQAESMQRELLLVQQRVLGPEDPSTLSTMGNICCSLSGLGRYADAEQMERQILGMKIRAYGAATLQPSRSNMVCCVAPCRHAVCRDEQCRHAAHHGEPRVHHSESIPVQRVDGHAEARALEATEDPRAGAPRDSQDGWPPLGLSVGPWPRRGRGSPHSADARDVAEACARRPPVRGPVRRRLGVHHVGARTRCSGGTRRVLPGTKGAL